MKFMVPYDEIGEFLDLLDPDETAIVKYRGYPHNDYLVDYDTPVTDDNIQYLEKE
jgi:hypothetical protein